MTRYGHLLWGTALLTSVSLAMAKGDSERGQSLYQSRCTACHSLEYNGVGPAHQGVFGRTAGKTSGYLYSEALKSSKVVWTDKMLNLWLADPEKFIPGQKMGISVPDANERADLIAYLKKASAP
jgi:cytochrome c